MIFNNEAYAGAVTKRVQQRLPSRNPYPRQVHIKDLRYVPDGQLVVAGLPSQLLVVAARPRLVVVGPLYRVPQHSLSHLLELEEP